MNARTLETQVSRLLSDEHAEVRELGEKLRAAGTGPAWNVHAREMTELVAEIRGTHPELAKHAATLLEREVKVAPTLVKYAAANAYRQETRRELEQAARELMAGAAIESAPVVDLVERGPSLEVEIAATLLYGACHYPFRQVRERVMALSAARVEELIWLGMRHRGRHDELLREFAAGAPLRFDILMDIGGFRDMHRHRRCLQTLQCFTAAHGFDVPEGRLAEAGMAGVTRRRPARRMRPSRRWRRAMRRRPGRRRATCCRWGRAAGRYSRWILRRRCTSASCGRRRRGISRIAGWHGRCTGRWNGSIRRWRGICE